MEMSRYIAWFNDSAPSSPNPLPAITRAAISHLWFESIHPFEDGNGRIGRAIAEKALAQSLAAPTLTALAETIHRHRKAYYSALQLGSQPPRRSMPTSPGRLMTSSVTLASSRYLRKGTVTLSRTAVFLPGAAII